jgi:hypothetical protein
MANRKPVALTLKRMANAKFAEAALLPPGPEQQEILILASGFLHAADVTQLACKRFARPPQYTAVKALLATRGALETSMKTIADHLKRALASERMADREEDPQIRAVFEKQAA